MLSTSSGKTFKSGNLPSDENCKDCRSQKQLLAVNSRLFIIRPLLVFLAVLVSSSASLFSEQWALAASARTSEKILWSFGAPLDGVNPAGGLVSDATGSLYGTTVNGGFNGVSADNSGTVFKLTSGGQESVLWSFGAGTDGYAPLVALLVDGSGNLYGTTSNGGLYNNFGNDPGGVVFEVTPGGQESVLWNFGNGADGHVPYAGLLVGTNGNFFGTTAGGGTNNNAGTAFELTPAGQETVLWNFGSGTDGISPKSTLIMDASGNLYGTTAYGGIYDSNPLQGLGGTVFRLAPVSGSAPKGISNYTESVLWNFGNGADGQNPNNLILDGSGNLFGATGAGGLYAAGTVFELTPAGQETILWNFGNGTDGQGPQGVIMDAAGNLYGTTGAGGLHTGCGGGVQGCGTVFELTPPSAPGGNWTETILWNFGNSISDGFFPSSGLLMDTSGNLYGETNGGGANFGGTVYELSNVTPSGQISLSSQHIQFPQTAAGGSSSVQLAVRNTGIGQLTGTIATPPAPFSLEGSGSFNLAPKTETKITLTFNPTAPTRAHQLTTVTSSSAKQSSVKLDLRGVGIPAPATLALNVR